MYKAKAYEYMERCHETKKFYYNIAVMDCNGDQGLMFSIINSLLHRSSASPHLDAEPGTDLATEFSHFFKAKLKGYMTNCQADRVQPKFRVMNHSLSVSLMIFNQSAQTHSSK